MTGSHSNCLTQHAFSQVKLQTFSSSLESLTLQGEDTKEALTAFTPDNGRNYAAGVCCLDEVLEGTLLRHKHGRAAQHGSTTTGL